MATFDAQARADLRENGAARDFSRGTVLSARGTHAARDDAHPTERLMTPPNSPPKSRQEKSFESYRSEKFSNCAESRSRDEDGPNAPSRATSFDHRLVPPAPATPRGRH